MGEYMGHLAQKDWEWLTQQLVLSPGAHMVEVELRKQVNLLVVTTHMCIMNPADC